LLGELNIDKN